MTCPDCANTAVDRDIWRRQALALAQEHPSKDDIELFLWRIWQDAATRHEATAKASEARLDAMGTRLALAERALRTSDPAHIAAWRNHPNLEDTE